MLWVFILYNSVKPAILSFRRNDDDSILGRSNRYNAAYYFRRRRLCGSQLKEIAFIPIRMDCCCIWLGLGVAMAAYAVGGISGAHLNPALTIGLALEGSFPWKDVPVYIAGQMIGAIIGAVIVYLHYLPHWKATDDPAAKLGVFSTGPSIPHTFGNMISEVIGTFVLVLGILAIGANEFTKG